MAVPISLTRETHESGGKNGLQAKAKVRAEAKAKAGALVSVAAFVAWPLGCLCLCLRLAQGLRRLRAFKLLGA